MAIFQDYMKLYEEANNYFWSDNAKETEIEKYSQKLNSVRDNFSKADWERLISESEGRAKYEYTRMMKERYPD